MLIAFSVAFSLTRVIFVYVREAAGHLLHLGVNRPLPVNLRDEAIHALSQTFRNRERHISNHVYDFLLPLEGFVVSLNHVEVVEVQCFIPKQSQVLLLAKALAWLPLLCLIDSILHLNLQMSRLLKRFISAKRIHGKLGHICLLVLIHLLPNSLAQLDPLVLLLNVLCLQVMNTLLLDLVLLVKHGQLSP